MVEQSAGAVIFRMEKGRPLYLLLHYEAGHWDFAKGHIEKGEKTEETIRRETDEEAGITDLRFVPGFKVTIRYWMRPRKTVKSARTKQASLKQKGVLKFVVFYLAETKTSNVTLSFEHQAYVWLPFEEAVKKATYKNAKDILIKAHQFLISRAP